MKNIEYINRDKSNGYYLIIRLKLLFIINLVILIILFKKIKGII